MIKTKSKSVDFLNKLCKYFANVGANMNKTLPQMTRN